MCVLAAGPLFGACAISASVRIGNAAGSVESAMRAEADKYAIYEYTHATEYLHKAREEYGYADYGVAGQFADEARRWGDKAREKARERPGADGGAVISSPQPMNTPLPAPAPVITPVPQGVQ